MKTINYILSLAIATTLFTSCQKESFEPSGNLSDTVTVAYLQDQIDQLQYELDSIKTRPVYIYTGTNLIETIYVDSTDSYIYRNFVIDKDRVNNKFTINSLSDSLSFDPNQLK